MVAFGERLGHRPGFEFQSLMEIRTRTSLASKVGIFSKPWVWRKELWRYVSLNLHWDVRRKSIE